MTAQLRERRSNKLSRRAFGQWLVGATAAAAAPLFVPARLLGAQAPSNRLRVGQIGCGRIAQVHDVPSVLRSGLADYVAVCDLDSRRATASREQVAAFYRKSASAAPEVKVYSNYRELLAHPDLDAVVISTPDHWHAQLVAAAILAGKDVYVQKPFTMTVAEGILLRDLVAKSGRIVQVGSQQRSTSQFRLACELVRSGRIGQVRRVEIGLPIDPTQPDDPRQPVPANLQYDEWLGRGRAQPPLDASDPRLLAPEGLSVQLPRSDEHHKNWLESVRSRREPIAPARIAHRSGSACIVSWIAMKLGRPVSWDARAERFVNDPLADALLARRERAPYGVGHLLRTQEVAANSTRSGRPLAM